MAGDPVRLAALVALALCLLLAAFLSFRRQPRLAVVMWAGSLFFTPVWLGGSLGGVFVTVLTLVTVLCLLSRAWVGVTWRIADTLVVLLACSVALAFLIGGAVVGHVQETVLMWFIPYLWGRIICAKVSLAWVGECISIAATIAALLAIIEFATGHNVFLGVPGASSSMWSALQYRAGFLRVEGAFGHSIALGGALAMSSGFITVARWPAWCRATALCIVGLAAALTFSRLGLIGFAITVALALILLGRYVGTALRVMVVSLSAVGGIFGLELILNVFGEAGAEASGSAEYRVDLLRLLGVMAPVGISPSREVLATGQDYWDGFRSIDSALILSGLRFGLVTLVILIALLVVLVVSVIKRPSAAGIALVGQIPAFATVALITQYGAFVWFLAGLATASYSLNVRGQAIDDRQIHRVAPTRGNAGAAWQK